MNGECMPTPEPIVSAMNGPLQPSMASVQATSALHGNFGALSIKGLIPPTIPLIATQSQRIVNM